MRKVHYLILFVFICFTTLAQHADQLRPLGSNPVLVQIARKKAAERITPPPPFIIKNLKLPFLDDFSKPSPVPDTNLWQNGGVYTNYTYPLNPHTLGVATFDGLDGAGLPYNPLAAPFLSYPADTLTSWFIKLGSYSPIDSIYFSFYWQAGGLGTYPKTNDSIILEFSNGTTWNRMWYQLGYAPLPSDTGFHYVAVPVTDPQYFINGFQFRFRSYACTAGNLDHWNIDEVYMNILRNYAYTDTTQQDVSFVYESPSLINNYRNEPWEQFIATDIKTKDTILERNNDSIAKNSSFNLTITGPTAPFNYTAGSFNFPSFYSVGYNNVTAAVDVPVSFPFTTLSGPAAWNITYMLSSSPDFDNWNDTLRYAQTFSNYYAYDDGTAEAAYSILGSGPPVSIACQYTLNKPDTLLGVYLFFNYVLANTRSYIFRLGLWGDGGGQPSATPVYEEDSLYSPVFDSLDQYVYYKFSVPQTVSGTTYVGLVVTSGDSINLGFDLNDNHQNQDFYNIGGVWNYSSYPGTIMMRPVFGNKKFNAVNEVSGSEKPI